MVILDVDTLPLAGTQAEQSLAREILAVFSARGRFMAADAPIRVRFDELVEYLKSTPAKGSEKSVAKVVEINPGTFVLESGEDGEYVVSTRSGRVPAIRSLDQTHSFQQRLMNPEPRPERTAAPLRPRPRGETTWSTLERVLSDLDSAEGDYALRRMLETESAALVSQIMDEEVTEAPDEEAVEAKTIVVPAATSTDVSTIGDQELAGAIRLRLAQDARVAHFGDEWMLEDRVPRLSRGDLRRIKEYIEEQEQPLTDDVLEQDVLEVRQRSTDYDLMRFALNYRLGAEHREFEFVGTNNQRFWSVSNLPSIGTTRRKATEIGSDYKFMLEELPEQPAYRSVSQVSHVLSFYEFHHGLLPYDPEIQALLGAPLIPGQRSAVLTFECPQSYATYLVELRYPTPNRGGFLLGLDDFFSESLIPGALLSIRATANDGHYIVEFEETKSQSYRLLELEDRRQRYVFRPTSFNCLVFEEYLLDEARYPGFAGDKPLDEKARRKPETVISRSFERRQNALDGGGFSATIAELLAASNVERPFSETYLRAILDGDESGAFAKDPDRDDAYTYIPGSIG